jgi:hypothetical protein
MHAPELRAAVLGMVAEGLGDAEIARRTGLARTTVRDMRRAGRSARPRCWRCWRPTRPIAFTAAEYAELLGLYLGDGHISELPRTQRLRISLDPWHEQVIADVEALLARGLPGNRVDRVRADRGRTVVLSVYSSHLSCLLPQHGLGPKHERPIVLEAWQRDAVAAAPWAFLRGLVHTDGCFFINRTGTYRYLSVDLHNRSADIRRLFVTACGLVGVSAREAGDRVRIYRRDDVARFCALVGAKW